MEPDKKFSIGQNITFKPKCLCKNNFDGPDYLHGGDDQGGVTAIVEKYRKYNPKYKCWELDVRFKGDDGWGYTMLESEFYEFDSITLPNPPESSKFFEGQDVILVNPYNGDSFFHFTPKDLVGTKGKILSVDMYDNTCKVSINTKEGWFKFSELKPVEDAPKQPEQVTPTLAKSKINFNY